MINNKDKYVIVGGCVLMILLVIILAVPDMMQIFMQLAESFSRFYKLNKLIAIVLGIGGFLVSFWTLINENDNRVKRVFAPYISASVGFAGIYYLVFIANPVCFYVLSYNGIDTKLTTSVLDFIYFSFVTVTTLGYGDIAPNHTVVRILVLMQIMFAFYLIIRATAKK